MTIDVGGSLQHTATTSRIQSSIHYQAWLCSSATLAMGSVVTTAASGMIGIPGCFTSTKPLRVKQEVSGFAM
jgi:hypothetical protein